jgi:hypothetical protein
MIERGLLQLTEVSEEHYLRLKQELGFPKEEPSHNHNGFAIITKPLFYRTFEDVLEEFKETRGGKKASVQRKDREWLRLRPAELTKNTIDRMGKLARERGFLYISFIGSKLTETNEIGFEYLEAESSVVSTNLQIPGDERSKYHWIGSEQRFHKIFALYRPQDIEAYAQARKDRISRKKKSWNSKREKQEQKVLRLLDNIRKQRRMDMPFDVSQ